MSERKPCGPTDDEMLCACGCGGDDSRCDYWGECYINNVQVAPEHTCCYIGGSHHVDPRVQVRQEDDSQMEEVLAVVRASAPPLSRLVASSDAGMGCELTAEEARSLVQLLAMIKGEVEEIKALQPALRANEARLMAERDLFRGHSVQLNSISWKVGVALGTVTSEQDSAPAGDVVTEVERLIDGYLRWKPTEFVPIEIDAEVAAAALRDSERERRYYSCASCGKQVNVDEAFDAAALCSGCMSEEGAVVTLPGTFDHIPAEDRGLAVEGFVRVNPHMRGIDFDTMMEILLDSDSHIPIIGDVVIGQDEATAFVAHFINIATFQEGA